MTTALRGPRSMGMGLPAGVDPEVFEDLKCVAQVSTFLEAVGEPIEFWEGLCLVNAQRQLVRRQISQLTMMGDKSRVQLAKPIVDKIRFVREQFGPTVRDLRLFLNRMTGLPIEGDRREMIIGFIVASAKGQESAKEWLKDPDKHLGKAAAKLAVIGGIADNYREALRPWSPPPPRHTLPEPAPPAQAAAAPPASTEAPAQAPLPQPGVEEAVFEEIETAAPEAEQPPEPPPEAPPAPAKSKTEAQPPPPTHVELPHGVDPDILEDVRRVEQCRKIFEETHQQIEVWEVFLLVMLDRDATKNKIEKLLDLKKNGKTQEFTEGALHLFESLLKMRAQYGRFVRPLREFLSTLQVGTFGKDTTEMALGFIVASTRGRERASQWMESPKSYRQEAAGRYEDIISRTMKYQTALRMTSTPDGQNC